MVIAFSISHTLQKICTSRVVKKLPIRFRVHSSIRFVVGSDTRWAMNLSSGRKLEGLSTQHRRLLMESHYAPVSAAGQCPLPDVLTGAIKSPSG